MLRRLFNLLSAVSLAVCVAAGVLWVRSRGGTDAVTFGQPGARWRVAAEGGRLKVDNAPEVNAAREAGELANVGASTRHAYAVHDEAALGERHEAFRAAAANRLREIDDIADPGSGTGGGRPSRPVRQTPSGSSPPNLPGWRPGRSSCWRP